MRQLPVRSGCWVLLASRTSSTPSGELSPLLSVWSTELTPKLISTSYRWCCASPTFDYPYILALADYLSTSGAAAKEAARALRKEFKHAVPEAQERAVRLTGILMRNTDLRFRGRFGEGEEAALPKTDHPSPDQNKSPARSSWGSFKISLRVRRRTPECARWCSECSPLSPSATR